MVVFPNGKINIGLNITGKRSDGYHDLSTIYYPLAINDILEIIDNTENSSDEIQVTYSGIKLDEKDNNLCVQAYHLLKKDFTHMPSVKLHLHKSIPIGAGLGGGSSDGAMTLHLLNSKYKLGLSAERLSIYATQLGSDCAFFLVNKPCYATSRGERLEEIPLNLSSYRILIINPGVHIGTKWAFSKLNVKNVGRTSIDLKESIRLPVEKWKGLIINDFEEVVFDIHPVIRRIKNILYAKGALYASMSGSGSTVYGIYHNTDTPVIDFPAPYFCKWL